MKYPTRWNIVSTGDVQIFEMILQKSSSLKIDVNAKNANGLTPLDFVKHLNSQEMVEMLEQNLSKKPCKISHCALFLVETLMTEEKRRMKSSFEYRIDFLFFVFLAFLVYNPRFLKSCDKNTKKNCIYQNEYVCSGILKFFLKESLLKNLYIVM